MPERTPSRYWVVTKPSAGGAVVARFDTAGETYIDERITDHPDFEVVSVAGKSELVNTTIDTTALTDEERDILGVPP